MKKKLIGTFILLFLMVGAISTIIIQNAIDDPKPIGTNIKIECIKNV